MELDRGYAALPPGSEVVFANRWRREDTLAHVLPRARPASIMVGSRAAAFPVGCAAVCN